MLERLKDAPTTRRFHLAERDRCRYQVSLGIGIQQYGNVQERAERQLMKRTLESNQCRQYVFTCILVK